MDDGFTTTACLVFARAIHLAACLLLLGVSTFEIVVIGSLIRKLPFLSPIWRRMKMYAVLIGTPAALLSGVAWFIVVAASMSDLPLSQALNASVLNLVWSQTRFGSLWRLRAIFVVVATVANLFGLRSNTSTRLRSALTWFTLACNAALVGSLAWSGHGQTGRWSQLHLTADVLHLLATAMWPIGLLPLGILLAALRRRPQEERWAAIPSITRRFSAMSLACVSVLAGTGLFNSYCLIGSVRALFTSDYGRLLLFKIALFVLMTGLGSVNLLYLKARVSAIQEFTPQNVDGAIAQLHANVIAEAALAVIVLLIVAILGVLPPAIGPS